MSEVRQYSYYINIHGERFECLKNLSVCSFCKILL